MIEENKKNKLTEKLGGLLILIWAILSVVFSFVFVVGFYLVMAFIVKVGWNAIFGVVQ